MYYIGICDDGKNICADMEEMVFRYASDHNLLMGLETWYTGEALCRYLKEEHPLDILFLDIDLLTMSGIEVAQFIRSQMERLSTYPAMLPTRRSCSKPSPWTF